MSIIYQHVTTGTEDELLLFPPGAGKTWNAVHALVGKATAGERTLYAGVSRKLCEQAMIWANHPGEVMAEKLPRTSKNCQQYKDANKLSGKGWSAVEHVCRGQQCPAFKSEKPTESACGWWQQWNDPDHLVWAVTHHHLPSGLPFRYHKPSVLILDEGTVHACLGWSGGLEDGFTDLDLENLADSMPITDPGIHHITLGDPLPGAATRLLLKLAGRLRRWEKPGSPMVKLFQRLKQGKRYQNNVIGTDAAGYLLGYDQGTSLDSATEKLLDDLLNEQRENLRVASSMPPRQRHTIKPLPEPSSLEGDSVPPNILPPLVNALEAARDIIKRQAGTAGAVPMAIDLHQSENVDPVFSIRIRTFTPLHVPKNCRVVALDATGSQELFEKCVGRPVNVVRVHVPFKGQVIQATDMKLPKATLLCSKGAVSRWVNEIKPYLIRLHKMHGKVLVVTFKELAFRLQSELKSFKGLEFHWFFGVRGEDFSSFPVQVTIGFPMSPPDMTYLDAAAIYQGEDIDTTWEKQWRPYRVVGHENDSESVGVEVLVPVDPRLRAVYELSSDHEFYQVACSRNRILRFNHQSIVLSQVPFLPEFRVPVQLTTVRELLDTGQKEATIEERVHQLADSILNRLGWVSKRFLEAILVEKRGSLVLSNGCELAAGSLILYTISHPAANYSDPQHRKLFNQRTTICSGLGFPNGMESRRFREAWASWESQTRWAGSDVSVKVKGKVGKPFQDVVYGDFNLWLWDNRDLVSHPDLVVTMDGGVVDGNTVDRLRDVTDVPGNRIVVDVSRVLPDGSLDDTVDMDADDYDAERERMLWVLQELGDDVSDDLDETAGKLARIKS